MTRMHRVAAIAVMAGLGLSCAMAPAQARWGDRQDQRQERRDWNGGYRRPPPVVYERRYDGGPYGGYGYVPPPVVYAPPVGIMLPGLTVQIR
jgi:hypothetical protein